MLQFTVHYSLHFIAPYFIAKFFFHENVKKAYFLMLASMLIDLDHLLADPIFDAGRCSINFHPLHSYPAIFVYFVMAFIPKVRIIAVGLLLHIATDWQDCLW